jgi:RNA polymerase sigma-70 factor (ECF subfamily)
MHDPSASDEAASPTREQFPRILAAARAGADWAWRDLYAVIAPALTRYLRARGVPDADDVVGETFIRVVRSIDGFEGDEGQFRTWVFTIGRNLVVDEVRKRGRRPSNATPDEGLTAAGPAGDTEDDAMRRLGTDRVREILARLSPDQRDVLLLRVLGGHTIAEIAEVVGKREGAVKMLQARGVAALRKQIATGAVTL